MRAIAKVLAAAAVVLALTGCPNLALKDAINRELGITSIRVGSIADSKSGGNGYTLDGAYMVTVRSKLLNTANFGPSGTVKRSIDITDITGTINAGVLSRLDVLFVGTIYDGYGYLSGSELSAIRTWVAGGGVVIATADFATASAVDTEFGYTTTDSGPASTDPVGAAIFDGPFGDLYTSGTPITANGYGTYFGSEAGLTVLGQDPGNSNAASVSLLPYGSGKVIFLATVDFIDDDIIGAGFYMSAGSSIVPSYPNDVFLGNLFAFVKH